MRTFGFRLELEQRLSSGVVRISEVDVDFWRGRGRGNVYVNLNLWNREVWERFQSILNRVGVLRCGHSLVDLDRTGVILATELVNKTKLEESRRRRVLKRARQFLVVLAAISLAVGFGIVTFGALAQ